MQINKITKERLDQWEKKLNSESATPVLIMGVKHGMNSGDLVITTTEDVSNKQLQFLLAKALQLLFEKP